MKNYLEPTLSITKFDAEDVVMASVFGDFVDSWLDVFKEGF